MRKRRTSFAPLGHDDALVAARLRVNDAIGVELLLGEGGEPFRAGEARTEQSDHGRDLRGAPAERRELRAEEVQRPHGDERVHQPEEEGGADQPELRREHERERDRHRERAEIVERKHRRYQLAKAQPIAEDAHDERDLEPDQHADPDHEPVEHEPESVAQVREREEHDRRGDAAEHRDRELDLEEARDQAGNDVARQERADAHRREVGPDHDRELGDRVAEEVARRRAGDELVDEPARGDDEDRGEERAAQCAGGEAGGVFGRDSLRGEHPVTPP